MPPPAAISRSPASPPPRPSGSPHGGRAGRTRSTIGRCRTSWTGCAPPCTSRRAAIAARRPSRRCTTSATRPRRIVALQLDGSDSRPARARRRGVRRRECRRRRHLRRAPLRGGPDRARRRAPQHPDRRRARRADRRRRDRRGAGGHRPARGGRDRQHPAPAPARPPSRLKAEPWATRRSRRRRPSPPAGARRFDPRRRLSRVQHSSIAILQIVVAATGAYAFAHYVLGHPAPLLAATVCVSSLGLVRDARPRRVLETVARDAGGDPRRRAAAARGRARAGGSSRSRSASRSSWRASSPRRRASRSPRRSRR